MGLEQYITSILDEPQVKVTLVEGVYHVTSEITRPKPTYIDSMTFLQINTTERINKKLKTYLPSDVDYKVFVYVRPNFAKLSNYKRNENLIQKDIR